MVDYTLPFLNEAMDSSMVKSMVFRSKEIIKGAFYPFLVYHGISSTTIRESPRPISYAFALSFDRRTLTYPPPDNSRKAEMHGGFSGSKDCKGINSRVDAVHLACQQALGAEASATTTTL